jgi:hypothetical protein
MYEEKRLAILGTTTSLVEIDLIRTGGPMRVIGPQPSSDYRILISRGNRRPRADLLWFGVRDPIPTFRLPLRKGDTEPEVDLASILRPLFDRAGYDMRVDYRNDPIPPLSESDRDWADHLLRASGLR